MRLFASLCFCAYLFPLRDNIRRDTGWYQRHLEMTTAFVPSSLFTGRRHVRLSSAVTSGFPYRRSAATASRSVTTCAIDISQKEVSIAEAKLYPETRGPVHCLQRCVAISRSALLVTCAVAAGFLLPTNVSARHSLRTSPASVNEVSDPGLSRRVSGNAKGATGAPMLFIHPGSAAMASTPVKVDAKAATTSATKYYRQRFSLKDRVMYAASEFLMWNSMARVLALLALGLVFIYLGSVVFSRLDPDGMETNKSPFWMAARSYLNPLEDDYSKNSLRALSVTMAMIGMVFCTFKQPRSTGASFTLCFFVREFFFHGVVLTFLLSCRQLASLWE